MNIVNKSSGWLLIAAGLVGALYFFFIFDTSVSTGAGSVNNIGLLSDRLIGILVSHAALIIGTLLVLFAPRVALPVKWLKWLAEGLLVWRQGLANLLTRWWQFGLIVVAGTGLVLADYSRWDDSVLQQIRQPDNAQFTSIARFFSDYGGGEWAVVVAVVLFVQGVVFGCPRWRQVAWACVLALLVSGIMVNLFRPTLGRARPHTGLPGDFHGPTLNSKFHGFPSGHTTSAFAPAAAIAAAAPVVGVPCLLFAGSVGWSRMQLNRHRPLDVMTGAALGTLIGLCFGSGVDGARFRLGKKQRG